jgi:hypothetical protein
MDLGLRILFFGLFGFGVDSFFFFFFLRLAGVPGCERGQSTYDDDYL